MCGIAGILEYHHPNRSAKPLSDMLEALRHRGPDDGGQNALETGSGGILHLGHQRLAIIDLSPGGHQPMSNDTRTLWISTNSELYNYSELREELRGRFEFHTQSDTEVLLKAYEAWGPDFLGRLEGMFALAIWDAPRQKLFLARDRMGIKPLYYYPGKRCFVFASELRAVLASGIPDRSLNPDGLTRFLAYGRISSPDTAIQGIQEMKPGHYMELDAKEGVWEETRYWCPLPSIDASPVLSSVREMIRDRLEHAVRIRMVGDVPVGAFLSGGIDSSAVVSVASSLETGALSTVSMVFDEEEYNEGPHARKVSETFGTEHWECALSGRDLLDGLAPALAAMDQPTVDAINTYFISRAARQFGLKVVLSGLGGDELFAGYDSFITVPKLKRIGHLLKGLPQPLRRGLAALLRRALPTTAQSTKLEHLVAGRTYGCSYTLFRALYCQTQLEKLLRDHAVLGNFIDQEVRECRETQIRIAHLDPINQVMYWELTHYLQNMLLRDTDMMSMAHGLEVRVPFLDPGLVHLMFSIPGQWKIRPECPKALLVQSLPKPLPRDIVRRKKMGFTLPFEKWMRGELKQEIQSVLESPLSVLDEFLDRQAALNIWKNFLKGRTSWSRPWALYVLKRWVARNIF